MLVVHSLSQKALPSIQNDNAPPLARLFGKRSCGDLLLESKFDGILIVDPIS